MVQPSAEEKRIKRGKRMKLPQTNLFKNVKRGNPSHRTESVERQTLFFRSLTFLNNDIPFRRSTLKRTQHAQSPTKQLKRTTGSLRPEMRKLFLSVAGHFTYT